MANYNKSLVLKEAVKIGSLPANTPLPKMPGWTPKHIRSGRDWIGKSSLLEKYLDEYLQRKVNDAIRHINILQNRGIFELFSITRVNSLVETKTPYTAK